jgi:hypothetical protein
LRVFSNLDAGTNIGSSRQGTGCYFGSSEGSSEGGSNRGPR